MFNYPSFPAPFLAASSLIAVRSTALVWGLLALAAVPALAEPVSVALAVTYAGTVGGQAVVLELSDFKDGPLVGRYPRCASQTATPC